MKLILLSGGSGKRLWPLSNDARSKQFLKLLTSDKGTMESMVQRVWRQLTAVGLHDDTYVATSSSQSEILQKQLNMSTRIIIEPERRDTFAAIALASLYLRDREQIDPNETVCILPVDPYVDLDYFWKIRSLDSLLDLKPNHLMLLGVKPTYPSEKYGYIVAENAKPDFLYKRVNTFVEKPNEETARKLIEKGALWNCGVFAFKMQFILDYLKEIDIPRSYEWVQSNYSLMPKNSFDYQVVEKSQLISVVSYSGQWKDLGTWNTITEEIKNPITGKGVQSPDCINTTIINELDIPVTVLGLSNAVIAVGPDGILVSDKSSSTQLKHITSDFKQRPMYEERLWGWYRILDYSRNKLEQEVLTKKIVITAGKNLSYQIHNDRTEIWTIISGSGECILDGIRSLVFAGDVITVNAGVRHALRATEEMELIEVQIGNELIEEDIIRQASIWEDISIF